MKTVLINILLLLIALCPLFGQKNDKLIKPERVYLQTDRNAYVAGEYLFYTLYLQGTPGEVSRYAYLVLRDRNNFALAEVRVEIKNQLAYGNIYIPDTIRTNMYQIICYTNFMRNEGEDAFFKKEIIIANRFDDKMDQFTGSIKSISPDSSYSRYSKIIKPDDNLLIHLKKPVYDQREKISFSLESKYLPSDSIARVSVSISEIIPGVPVESSIAENFGDDIKRSPAVESDQYHFRFLREINGPVLQGQVLPATQAGEGNDSITENETNGAGNSTVLVSTVDSIVNMQFTTTDSVGSFRFLLNPYYDGKELIIRLKDKTSSTIFIDDKLSSVKPYAPSAIFNVPGIKDYLIRCGKIAQIKKFYREQTVITTEKEFLPSKTIPRVYYKQNSAIFPSDFLELEDLVEISREIIPGLKVRKSENKFVSGYPNLQAQTHTNAEPAIFLDGVPIDDVNQIIKLGTSRIKRIESLPVTRYYGEMSFPGIMAVFSKDLEIKNIQFNTPTIKYQTFASQPYSKPEPFNPINNKQHIPDLRQLLLWIPEIVLKKNEILNIEGYTSDLPGKYRINIQGITSGGIPVHGSAIITVKPKTY